MGADARGPRPARPAPIDDRAPSIDEGFGAKGEEVLVMGAFGGVIGRSARERLVL
jgi:hypothetical protein